MSEKYKIINKILTKKEKDILKSKSVAILGLGGLGGYSLEFFTRIGIGNIHILDFDNFEESNLNRQLLSNKNNIGKSKIIEAKKRAIAINNDVNIVLNKEKLNKNNANILFKKVDIIVDGLDNYKAKCIAATVSKKLDKTFIYGSVSNYSGIVSTIMPCDNTFDILYKNYKHSKIKKNHTLSFVPPLIASIQVSEALKVLFKKNDLLSKKILLINLAKNTFNILNLA